MDGSDLARRSVAEPSLPRHLNHAVRYLRDNLECKIVLSELARAAGVLKAHVAEAVRSGAWDVTVGLFAPASSDRRAPGNIAGELHIDRRHRNAFWLLPLWALRHRLSEMLRRRRPQPHIDWHARNGA